MKTAPVLEFLQACGMANPLYGNKNTVFVMPNSQLVVFERHKRRFRLPDVHLYPVPPETKQAEHLLAVQQGRQDSLTIHQMWRLWQVYASQAETVTGDVGLTARGVCIYQAAARTMLHWPGFEPAHSFEDCLRIAAIVFDIKLAQQFVLRGMPMDVIEGIVIGAQHQGLMLDLYPVTKLTPFELERFLS